MKIGATAAPVFGARPKPTVKQSVVKKTAVKTVSKIKRIPIKAKDDFLEVDLNKKTAKPTIPIKKRLSVRDRLIKQAKEAADYDEEEDFEYIEEEDLPPPNAKRSKSTALAISQDLGIKSFEVGVEDEPVEETLPEEIDGVEDYNNVKINNQKIDAPSRLPGAPTNRVRAIRTMFGQRSDKILDLLENDANTDGALTLIQRTLLQTMVDILPVIERSVRRSHAKRGLVPLNQTVSQIRELVGDIQHLRDKGQLGANIIERLLRPAFMDIAVQMALAFNNIELSAKLKMTPEDYLLFMEEVINNKKALAEYVKDQYNEVKDGVASSLS